MIKASRILVPLAALAVIAGCAKQQSLSSGQKSKEYLELYMSKAYPDVTPDQWGIYVLEDIPGTGYTWNEEFAYTLLNSTVRTLDGTIVSSTEADIAKQLDENSYKSYNYYGPKYQNTSSGSGYAGLEYILKGMKVGGTKTAVIPCWLITTSRFSTKEEYIKASSTSTHLIYTITFAGQCGDISTQEIATLRQYVNENFGPDVKSCSYKKDMTEGTFYFVSDTTSFKEEDKRADDATLYLKYVGRRLDGVAFDTNDQATALKEGLFVKERTYEKSKVVFSSTYSSITMDGSSSLVDGFLGALYKMHWSGQKATVLFVSTLGYGSTGSGDVIPPYVPLIFELELSSNE